MRVLRKREVLSRIAVSPMTLWRWEKAGEFPGRVRLGKSAVGYLENEVDEWLLAKAANRNG